MLSLSEILTKFGEGLVQQYPYFSTDMQKCIEVICKAAGVSRNQKAAPFMIGHKLITTLLTGFYRRYGIKYKAHGDISLQLCRYFNFRLKYIPVTPRQVRVSSELAANINASPHQSGINEIMYRAATGLDLNPFQSKDSFNADFNDLLFNDWGVHHLHLSCKKDSAKDFFHSRTGALLFVRFTDQIAYLLDIKHHKDPNVWSDRDLLRIIQRNWETTISNKEVKNVSWSEDLSDADLGALRRKGYMTGVDVDGKFYLFLGHGHASSGDNIMAARLADRVIRWIGLNQDLFHSDLNRFAAALKTELFL